MNIQKIEFKNKTDSKIPRNITGNTTIKKGL
jgi:hypothetical protein